MPGATTSPLDLIMGPTYGRKTYHTTSTTSPRRTFSIISPPLPMNLLPSSNPTHCHPYLGHTCSNQRLRRGSLTGISHCSYTAAYHWSVRGHTNTAPSCVYVCMCVCVCVCACVIYVLLNLTIFHTIPVVDFLCISNPFAIPATRRLRCLH